MMKCGVRIWEYQPSMMHAKTMLVDDEIVLVGSINFDPLSLNKLEEVALVAEDRGLAAELADAFAADCTHAKEFTKS
jgi:cardiolipin synthase